MSNVDIGLELTKLDQVEELVEFIIDAWDMNTLIEYATDNLTEYYMNPDNKDDLTSNYENMLEIRGS